MYATEYEDIEIDAIKDIIAEKLAARTSVQKDIARDICDSLSTKFSEGLVLWSKLTHPHIDHRERGKTIKQTTSLHSTPE